MVSWGAGRALVIKSELLLKMLESNSFRRMVEAWEFA
jgi:hypothetical protein